MPELRVSDTGTLWLLDDVDGEAFAMSLGHVTEAEQNVPEPLRAEYERLRADYRDSLDGGHEAEARFSYLNAIGATS